VYQTDTEKIELVSYWNGNGKLMATENVILYVSYGILTDKRNSYAFLKRITEIRTRMNGYALGIRLQMQTAQHVVRDVAYRLRD